ncbi:hypothetical protein [Streptomyces prunicolor]|uniref:hypothetical protein n=1 Tax=Streptomyces prunicolor TaxID=67348 RepID=UPI00131A251D|nr:hypothetical protein [Streptomyces prunicolor]
MAVLYSAVVPQTSDEKIMDCLRENAEQFEALAEELGIEHVDDDREAPNFLEAVRREQDEALKAGKPELDIREFHAEANHRSQRFGILELREVLVSGAVRRARQERQDARRKALAALREPTGEFVDAVNLSMASVPAARGRLRPTALRVPPRGRRRPTG